MLNIDIGVGSGSKVKALYGYESYCIEFLNKVTQDVFTILHGAFHGETIGNFDEITSYHFSTDFESLVKIEARVHGSAFKEYSLTLSNGSYILYDHVNKQNLSWADDEDLFRDKGSDIVDITSLKLAQYLFPIQREYFLNEGIKGFRKSLPVVRVTGVVVYSPSGTCNSLPRISFYVPSNTSKKGSPYAQYTKYARFNLIHTSSSAYPLAFKIYDECTGSLKVTEDFLTIEVGLRRSPLGKWVFGYDSMPLKGNEELILNYAYEFFGKFK